MKLKNNAKISQLVSGSKITRLNTDMIFNNIGQLKTKYSSTSIKLLSILVLLLKKSGSFSHEFQREKLKSVLLLKNFEYNKLNLKKKDQLNKQKKK